MALEVGSGTALEVGSGMALDWQMVTKETVQTSHSSGEQLAIDSVMTDSHHSSYQNLQQQFIHCVSTPHAGITNIPPHFIIIIFWRT